jgi:hypothetical protein
MDSIGLPPSVLGGSRVQGPEAGGLAAELDGDEKTRIGGGGIGGIRHARCARGLWGGATEITGILHHLS